MSSRTWSQVLLLIGSGGLFTLLLAVLPLDKSPSPKLLIPNGYPDAGADAITPLPELQVLTCALQALYPRQIREIALYAETHVGLGAAHKISPWLLAAIAMNETQHRWYAIGPGGEVGVYQLLWKKPSPSREKLLANQGALAASLAVQELRGWRDYHQETCKDDHPWWAHYNWGGRVFRKGRHAGYPARVLGYLAQLEKAAKVCSLQ